MASAMKVSVAPPAHGSSTSREVPKSCPVRGWAHRAMGGGEADQVWTGGRRPTQIMMVCGLCGGGRGVLRQTGTHHCVVVLFFGARHSVAQGSIGKRAVCRCTSALPTCTSLAWIGGRPLRCRAAATSAAVAAAADCCWAVSPGFSLEASRWTRWTHSELSTMGRMLKRFGSPFTGPTARAAARRWIQAS